MNKPTNFDQDESIRWEILSAFGSLRLAVARCGSLWLAAARCGSLRLAARCGSF
jgi:hypothetical protein